MSTHDVAVIANEFIKRARREGRSVTNMQLQKLPYIAHGWSLALRDAPLVEQNPRAWRYGPVYPELYDALKQYGAGDVTDLIRVPNANTCSEDDGSVICSKFTPEEERFLDAIWGAYKEKNGLTLSTLTHQPGTPWTITYADGAGRDCYIPNDLIKAHYEELKAKASAQ